MADKRMFSKQIIDSDMFLDMSLSTQALYFHLCMRADDDGFINNPKRIQRLIGCGDDELKLLIAKSFVIPFETGVCVIKHWRVHNYIKGDRYKPTLCQDEKQQLKLGNTKAYEFVTEEEKMLEPGRNQNGTSMEPNRNQTGTSDKIRLDKNSIDKNSIDKEEMELGNSSREFNIFTYFQQRGFVSISPMMYEDINSLVDMYSLEEVKQAVDIADENGIHKLTYVKGVLERRRAGETKKPNYNNKGKGTNFSNFEGRDYSSKDYEELEQRLLGWDKDV